MNPYRLSIRGIYIKEDPILEARRKTKESISDIKGHVKANKKFLRGTK